MNRKIKYYRLFNKDGKIYYSILSSCFLRRINLDSVPTPDHLVGCENIIVPIVQIVELCKKNNSSIDDAYFDGPTLIENIKFDSKKEKFLMNHKSIKLDYISKLNKILDEEQEKDSPDVTKVVKTMLELRKLVGYSKLKWFEIAQQSCPDSKVEIKKLLSKKIEELSGKTTLMEESSGKKRQKKEKKTQLNAEKQ